ncbi:MAG: hypothetical protein VB070_08015 [Clostridiaceae bacterium]|nr:hypothetical protein [Clostridiaceae bacterium]
MKTTGQPTRLTSQETSVLRDLAAQYAAMAALPAQQEKKALWQALTNLKMIRPMVAIDQIPWHECSDSSLHLAVGQPYWRGIEQEFRRKLFQWRYFPADMVADPVLPVAKAFSDSGFGIKTQEDIVSLDPQNSVVGHAYYNQIKSEQDLIKLQVPEVRLDREETERREQEAHQLFDGILPVRMCGFTPSFALWDRLAEWMGPESILYDLADRPEFIHAIMERFTNAALGYVDRLEELGLLDAESNTIHCSYNYNDQLPAAGYNPQKPRASDCWTMGMAQIFSAVSPAMHEEFEIRYVGRIFERFGLVYYGCCEPLHDRIEYIRQLPHVRKISCSPWCHVGVAAAKIGQDYVLSRKPSPAFLATDQVDWAAVENDLRTTRYLCAEYGTPLEYILKDVSTIRYQPQRLTDWSKLALDVAAGD